MTRNRLLRRTLKVVIGKRPWSDCVYRRWMNSKARGWHLKWVFFRVPLLYYWWRSYWPGYFIRIRIGKSASDCSVDHYWLSVSYFCGASMCTDGDRPVSFCFTTIRLIWIFFAEFADFHSFLSTPFPLNQVWIMCWYLKSIRGTTYPNNISWNLAHASV